jgi:hypothetical protein
MSSETLQQKSARIKPGGESQPDSGKLLGYYANLSENIKTTELTQLQLRELIATLLSVSSGYREDGFLKQPFNLKHRVSQPKWVGEKWKILMQDPVGVIKWAVQFLTDEQRGCK